MSIGQVMPPDVRVQPVEQRLRVPPDLRHPLACRRRPEPWLEPVVPGHRHALVSQQPLARMVTWIALGDDPQLLAADVIAVVITTIGASSLIHAERACIERARVDPGQHVSSTPIPSSGGPGPAG